MDEFILQTDDCPVIKRGTKVKVLHTFRFVNTPVVFATVEDLENFNLNFKGHKEAILSTFKLKTEDCLVHI